MTKHNPLDRELSKAETSQIAGFYLQGASVIEIAGIMELRPDTVENVIETYLGTKLIEKGKA